MSDRVRSENGRYISADKLSSNEKSRAVRRRGRRHNRKEAAELFPPRWS